ncbi:MAG TPA: RNA polymerase sigma factor RpoD/SigA [Thermoanaerobaculaceae bacterium]|nr:RNA polymerase sigma factor RpoD/SigA [Thermoanaerobaculaceae bacterium]HRS17453.1 RNA polymerase sigma factor RpoD/SigA [Thermoanaerobaculaceae bacterium]
MTSDERHRDPEASLLRRYLQEIGRFRQLTPEEEKELGARVKANGDPEALRQLVEANLRFVVAYAKRFRHSRVSLLDLINEGNIGLIQAARKFDPDKNVKFITYAVWWIRQAILHALSQHGATFRLPQKQANVLYRIERSRQALGRELERAPTEAELAEELDMSPEEVRLLLSSNQSILSLNEPVDEEGEAELGDLLEQYLMPDTDERILRESFEQTLREALEKLSEKERQVVALRFGLDDDNPLTLREIGERLGISRERVRQIENQALTKLRRSSQVRALAGYLN